MKMNIEWHEVCLRNQKRTLDEKRKKAERLSRECERQSKEINIYVAQIRAAKSEKINSFDRDKYFINRSSKWIK